MNEKLAANWVTLERETDWAKKRNVISSTKIHLSLNKSISRGVKTGLTILLWILQLCSLSNTILATTYLGSFNTNYQHWLYYFQNCWSGPSLTWFYRIIFMK
jgi:hypothetical protein